MKNSKFIPLYETIINRYKQGNGFLDGDLVELIPDYKSHEDYKKLGSNIQAILDDAGKSKLNLRVGRLHTPDSQYGSFGYQNLPATHADVYQELSPGNFGNLMTLPITLIKVIDTGVNLSPVSSKNKRKKGDYQKPGKWVANEEPETEDQNELGHKQNWVEKGDYKLAEKNKKNSVGANSYDDSKPSTNYKPLPKNKLKPKTLKESKQLLADLYVSILSEDVGMMGDGDTGMEEEGKYDNVATYERHMIKDECWDHGKQGPVDECYEEDGVTVKAECLQEYTAEPEAREETMWEKKEKDVCPTCGKAPCECEEVEEKICPKCGKELCECEMTEAEKMLITGSKKSNS